MHKRSMEAAMKMKEQENGSLQHPDDDQRRLSASPGSSSSSSSTDEADSRATANRPTSSVGQDDLRSDSIASLRAKALCYSARVQRSAVDPRSPAHRRAYSSTGVSKNLARFQKRQERRVGTAEDDLGDSGGQSES